MTPGAKAIRGALADYERAGEDRDSSRMADPALHRAIADATHNPHLTSLSLSIRHDISFGFGAEPYSPEVRGRALHARVMLRARPPQDHRSSPCPVPP